MQNKTTRTNGNGKNITLFVFLKKLIYSFNSRRLAPLSPSPKHYNVHPYRVAPFQHTPTPIVTHAPQRSTFVWNIVKILRYYVKLQENVKNWQFSEIFLQNAFPHKLQIFEVLTVKPICNISKYCRKWTEIDISFFCVFNVSFDAARHEYRWWKEQQSPRCWFRIIFHWRWYRMMISYKSGWRLCDGIKQRQHINSV